jgi:acetyl-CoA C-acetyltransferase
MPVLVGAGIADPASDNEEEAAALMIDAVLAAGSDAGSPRLLAAADRIVVPQGTWSYPDPGRLVGTAIGATGATTWLVDIGIPQQTLVNDALVTILAGEARVVVVAGGEARAREQRARRQGLVAAETEQGDAVPDVHVRRPDGEMIAPAEIEAGIVVPVEQYAVMENALRDADGQSIEEHRTAIARLWAGFNAVARHNPHAAFPAPMDAPAIAAAGPANRPLAFPYLKWHASQWNVDQAAALVLCSVSAARDFGIPEEHWVFPLAGLESSTSISLSRRRDLHAWPAMGVLGAAAADRLGRPLAEVEHVELYSCFPAAVRIQQRELGLSSERAPTFTGGMAFAGGPFNNFVLQATAELADRLRRQPGTTGLVTTVSGMLTKPGLALWSTRADGQPPLVADLAKQALPATQTVGVTSGYVGPASVVSYTVTYKGQDPARVAIIGETPSGERCVAVAHDPVLAARAVDRELIGDRVEVGGASFSA